MKNNNTPEKKKRKFSLFDNMFCISLVAFLLIAFGQTLGKYVTTPGIAFTFDALIPGFSSADAWRTAGLYMDFVGI
jgi:hypothetical protein